MRVSAAACKLGEMSDTTELQRKELIQQGFQLIEEELAHLMELFGGILQRLGHRDIAEALPWRGEKKEISESAAGSTALTQAFSVAFQLLNMVEERVSVQVRRARVKTYGTESIRGSWAGEMAAMRAAGVTEQELSDLIGRVQVEPVLTAHPTEAKRKVVRERHRELYELLRRSENPQLTEGEKKRLDRALEVSLETLWRTGEVHLERPDIESELKMALHYLAEVFPRVLHEVRDHLRSAWTESGWQGEPAFPRLRCGTWIGGDRDGHPGVTAEVTQNTLSTLRGEALDLFANQMDQLAGELSLSRRRQVVPEALLQRIEELTAKLDQEELQQKRSYDFYEEPWRELCALMAATLRNAKTEETGSVYQHPQELDDDFVLLEESLQEVGAGQLAHELVFPLRHQLRAFGFHLARLDVRQNSGFHDRAMEQLLQQAGVEDGEKFSQWPEERRMEFCRKELASSRPFLPPGSQLDGEIGAVLACLSVLAQQRAQGREKGIGALIVSMTRSVSDLLVVALLCREAGLVVKADQQGDLPFLLPQPIVPLFETLDDLKAAPAIMAEFLDEPIVYESTLHWVKREDLPEGGPQRLTQVMLGYSDSNKDCGIIASAHALYEAQDLLTKIARQRNVELAFFHGRGGTISRGAGPTSWFLESLPSGSIGSVFRMTEQGETVAQKYAHHSSAVYHVETLLASITGVIARKKQQNSEVISTDGLQSLAELAQKSKDAYQKLLKTDGFLTFYRQATPIDALENSRIGSRPSRRTGKQKSLDDLRAIPWVFSWTQARFYLPGWYGAGYALESFAADADRWQSFCDAVQESVLLRYIFTNIETNLASAKPEVMRGYAELVEEQEIKDFFLTEIVSEHARATKYIALLFGQQFPERRLRLARTLAIREEPLDVLHQEQVKLLSSWRKLKATSEEQAEEFFPTVLANINAIASGLRTTG